MRVCFWASLASSAICAAYAAAEFCAGNALYAALYAVIAAGLSGNAAAAWSVK